MEEVAFIWDLQLYTLNLNIHFHLQANHQPVGPSFSSVKQTQLSQPSSCLSSLLFPGFNVPIGVIYTYTVTVTKCLEVSPQEICIPLQG